MHLLQCLAHEKWLRFQLSKIEFMQLSFILRKHVGIMPAILISTYHLYGYWWCWQSNCEYLDKIIHRRWMYNCGLKAQHLGCTLILNADSMNNWNGSIQANNCQCTSCTARPPFVTYTSKVSWTVQTLKVPSYYEFLNKALTIERHFLSAVLRFLPLKCLVNNNPVISRFHMVSRASKHISFLSHHSSFYFYLPLFRPNSQAWEDISLSFSLSNASVPFRIHLI